MTDERLPKQALYTEQQEHEEFATEEIFVRYSKTEHEKYQSPFRKEEAEVGVKEGEQEEKDEDED